MFHQPLIQSILFYHYRKMTPISINQSNNHWSSVEESVKERKKERKKDQKEELTLPLNIFEEGKVRITPNFI